MRVVELHLPFSSGSVQRRGYEVWWSDERKYIAYTYHNGMKCRYNKLHDDKHFKEFLVRMDEEYGYKEEHQQSM